VTTKIYVIILSSSFGLIILGAIIGGILESTGILTIDTIDPKTITAIKVIYFILFCAIAFAFVPLAIKLFIFLQIKIGNGELLIIKWLQAHEQIIAYCGWGVFVLGLIIALPAAIRDGFFE